MKTLVIHPTDSTTTFLTDIYIGKGWDVISGKITNSELKRQIKSHDRIVMLGHGCEEGLYDMAQKRMFIDSSLVYLLREKYCVGIWCNANVFFEKYNLKGFYTGMIISEIDEAYLFSVMCNYDMIVESNKLFATSIKESIDSTDMLSEAKSKYIGDSNNIIGFNKNNLFYAD